ncbi:hypothetical protein E4U31_004902 [Claviceps sp. LM219 group G6]|nr:hypothetical protein E4U31_004902 [Claviceps sp. LM219 group G6]
MGSYVLVDPLVHSSCGIVNRRNEYEFEVKQGRLLVLVSFYTFEEQAAATPRNGRRDRRKRRPTAVRRLRGRGRGRLSVQRVVEYRDSFSANKVDKKFDVVKDSDLLDKHGSTTSEK